VGPEREHAAPQPLRLEVFGDGKQPLVRITGEIDVTTAPLVRSQLANLVDSGAQRILLDLDGVHFIDSTGLGVLVGTLRRLQEERGGRVRVEAVQDRVRRIFEITGLGPMFGLAPR
jgi:anti-sigma B factor antagonist